MNKFKLVITLVAGDLEVLYLEDMTFQQAEAVATAYAKREDVEFVRLYSANSFMEVRHYDN